MRGFLPSTLILCLALTAHVSVSNVRAVDDSTTGNIDEIEESADDYEGARVAFYVYVRAFSHDYISLYISDYI